MESLELVDLLESIEFVVRKPFEQGLHFPCLVLMTAQLHANNDQYWDRAVVDVGPGSAHVMVFSGLDAAGKDVEYDDPGSGVLLLNVLAFDPNFRNGGYLHAIDNNVSGWTPTRNQTDTLLVVPGPGGGPVVDEFQFSVPDGQMELKSSFFAPFPVSFRGGLQVSSGDVNGDGIKDAVFLPAVGGGPQFVAVDLQTHEQLLSIWVGDPADQTGNARFDPTGGVITTPHLEQAVAIQYGPIDPSTNHAPTRVWTLAGVDVTWEYATP